ncbi:hypothetical protein ACCC97_21285 [Variovorax sp. Varisp85]|uniref:hypothetical protein n=1 Tax=Variovorax sp. Varisp85 TaxID=3243059 RepID=UPI0039A59C5B
MALDQLLALCECTGFLDGLRNVVDAVDQLPVTAVLSLHLQRLELCGRDLLGLVETVFPRRRRVAVLGGVPV